HMDGRGYPYGLHGQQIPLMARIIGVADTLDAMTTNRPYQSAMELDYAMDRIRALTGSKFDAVVVTALESAINAGKLRLRAIAAHSSPQPGAQKEDAMLISITRDGRVFFRDHRIARADLANEIREGMHNGAEKKVYLVVDARAKYGDAIPVLTQIRFAGIENVNFLTEEPYR